MLGGLAIYISIAAFSLTACFLGQHAHWISVGMPVVVSAGLCCAVGLWDDRFGMQAKMKFLLTVAAVLPAAIACAPASLYAFRCEFELGLLAVPMTAIWLVVCTHIVNLLDGLDGLAAMLGVAAMSCVAMVGLIIGDVVSAVLAMLVMVSIAGFLVHNWPPAKVYLGDAGSLTIGLLCGALSVSVFHVEGAARIIPSIGLLAIPVIDAAFAITRRFLEGRSIACADREHIHHCMLSYSTSKTSALLTISALSLFIAVASVTSFFTSRDVIVVVVVFIVFFWLAASGRFGRREIGLAAERFRNREIKHEQPWLANGNGKAARDAA